MAPPTANRQIGRAVVWLARQVEVVLAARELTLAQYRVLAVLDEGPATASSLAARLDVSRPSVTVVVDGLVARDLVRRGTDDQDRRRVTHQLTLAGRTTIGGADETIEAGLAGVLGHLDDEGARELAAGFTSLHALTERIARSLAAQERP